MPSSSGYQYTFGALARASVDLDSIDEQLNDIRRVLESECALSQGTFGYAAEFGRMQYEKFRSDWREELDFGIEEARKLADNSARTDQGYLHAENARLNDLLYAVGWSPNASGKFKEQPPMPDAGHPNVSVDNDGSWLHRGLLDVGLVGLGVNSWALRRYPEWRKLSKQSRMAARGNQQINMKNPTWRGVIETGKSPVPPGHTWYMRGNNMVKLKSESAVLSKSTTSILRFARRFSWAAIAAGVVWELLAIPSDGELTRAMHGWEEIAGKARQIFGTDLAALRELALADWRGVAKNAADDRIFQFIRGGIDLADFATSMAGRLANFIEQLNTLHTFAYWTASITVGALIAHAALSFIPAMRPIAEFLGSQLTTMVLMILTLAPAAAASVFSNELKRAFFSLNTFQAGRAAVMDSDWRFGWK